MKNTTRNYEVNYSLRKQNMPRQRMIITTTDSMSAVRIFEQQNPGAKRNGMPKRIG